ncbi:N-acetylmuramoyl-L-alanine amidase [Bacillus salitolerans]|uniref:N-acetylmuramoyl-L-alanine amidase n=1 Tax=Bacillus salitolerans TaxID=1437434 RepID=A0ABW4LP33_9BACI
MSKKVIPSILCCFLSFFLFAFVAVADTSSNPSDGSGENNPPGSEVEAPGDENVSEENPDENETEQGENEESSDTSSSEETEESNPTPSGKEVTVNYADVASDFFAFREISYLSSMAIIMGYDLNGERVFYPFNDVTRAQAAKMIVEALGAEQLIVTESSFKDVPLDHWASGYIERAYALGIISGYQNGNFGPNDTLKRSQMSKILVNGFSLENTYVASEAKASSIFLDVQSDHWASPYITTLFNEGITIGSNGKYLPESNISRAQFSIFLSRTLNEEFRVNVLGPLSGTGTVTAKSSLNIRSLPSTASAVIGTLSNGQKVDVYGSVGYWLQIKYNNQIGYIHKHYIKQNGLSNPLQGRIIVIDAGHGGKDPGAIANNAQEKDIVIKIAQKLNEMLKKDEATVIMTRNDDTFLSLQERVDFAKGHFADAFISIHSNAVDNKDIKGTETYYDTSENNNPDESKKLASEIQSQIVAMAKMENRGIKDKGFYVIRNNDIPSVLVELGFLTNEEDANKLKSDEYVNIFAEAIYNGIKLYYEK